jgi:anti-sigma factor RsiW
VKTEELSISIAQYADGTLPDAERARVEALLESDAGAQAAVREEQALTALLRSDPMPQLDWDQLAVRFSAAIDDQMQARVDRASWAMRLRSATAYFGARGMIAAAASFVIGLGLATYLLRPAPKSLADGGLKSVVDSQSPNAASVAMVVDGPQEDQPLGRAVEEVSIGPGGSYASAAGPSPYSDDISARPARVMIAADAPTEPTLIPASPF